MIFRQNILLFATSGLYKNSTDLYLQHRKKFFHMRDPQIAR